MKLGRGFLQTLTVAIAIGLIVFGIIGLKGYFADESLKSSVPSVVISESLAKPGTSDITQACKDAHISSTKPKYIYIEALRTSGCIHKVGVDQQGLIATPVNVGLAGWYVSSVVPGAPGVSIIDGFMQSGDTEGLFARLDTLTTGDTIRIQYGNGDKQYFSVVDTQTYKGASYTSHISDPLSTNPRQLTLVGIDTSTSPTTYTLVRSELQQ